MMVLLLRIAITDGAGATGTPMNAIVAISVDACHAGWVASVLLR